MSECPAAPALFRPQILLFGDSITQQSFDSSGWGAQLSNQYARKADVLNRGFSGYTTKWALPTMDKFMVKGALLLTIFFGANDCATPEGLSAPQHVPVDEYRSNLEAMVAIAKANETQNILLITQPPIDDQVRIDFVRETYGNASQGKPDRLNSVAGEYAAACRQAANNTGVPVLDVWTRLQEQENWRSFLSDGLHLSPKGNDAVFQELQAVISDQLPHLAVSELPLDVPLHRDLIG